MENLTHDVFISYSSCDQKIAEGLSAYLEQNGIRCFVAYRDIPHGVIWSAAITKAIEDCQMMVIIFSDNFNKSVQVGREIEMCANENKPILTFKITDHEFEGTAKYYLNSINWIDAFPNPQKSFGEVLTSIKKIINVTCDNNVLEKKQVDSPKNGGKLLKNKIKILSIFIFCVVMVCAGGYYYYNKQQKNKEYQAILKQAAEYGGKTNWSKALELYNKALELNSEDADLYNKIGFAYFLEDRIEKAIEAYERSIAIDPSCSDSHYQMGLIFSQKQDNHKAIEYYIEAIKKDSTVDAYYYSLGVSYSDLELHDKALECFERKAKLAPSDDAFFMMACEYEALNDYASAIECLKKSIVMNLKNPNYYYVAARVYGKVGDKDNEKSNYEKSALLGDEDAKKWIKLHN